MFTKFHVHMSTVARLLDRRGSVATLGMNGFLARLLSFIDTNSAFLLGTNLYLMEFGLMPHYRPYDPRRADQALSQADFPMSNSEIVNLERFIGLMSGGNETLRNIQSAILERAAITRRRVQESDTVLN